MRASTEGGSGIHLIQGMLSSDSDEDEDYDFTFHHGDTGSPPGMIKRNFKFQSHLSFPRGGRGEESDSEYFGGAAIFGAQGFFVPTAPCPQ